VDEFIKHARQYSNDVGITTNGLLLKGCLSKLISAGINRIHVSIPPNIISNKNGFDSIKYLDELKEIIKEAESQAVNMKINLPLSEIPSKKNILSKIINFNTPIRILTLFDFNGNSPMEHQNEYSFRKLNFEKYQDRIHLREHFTPNGVRCDQCNSLLNCKEKSRSLRLGVDNVLRPCLASREWDVKLSLNNIDESLKVATALALDY
jgi:molybdenum cofactor biosynthesis enzyme MoaA